LFIAIHRLVLEERRQIVVRSAAIKLRQALSLLAGVSEDGGNLDACDFTCRTYVRLANIAAAKNADVGHGIDERFTLSELSVGVRALAGSIH
jgi:hypothetical protein